MGQRGATMREEQTIRKIRGELVPPSGATVLNRNFGHDLCRPLLPKHRVGKPGQYPKLFIQVTPTTSAASLAIWRFGP